MTSQNVHLLQKAYDCLNPDTFFTFWEVMSKDCDICVLDDRLEHLDKWLQQVGATFAECHPAACKKLINRVKVIPQEYLCIDESPEYVEVRPFPSFVIFGAYYFYFILKKSQLLTAQDIETRELTPGVLVALDDLEQALKKREKVENVDRLLVDFSEYFFRFVKVIAESNQGDTTLDEQ